MKADHHIRLFDLQYMSRTECMQAFDASSHAKFSDPPFGINNSTIIHKTKSHDKITFDASSRKNHVFSTYLCFLFALNCFT